MIKIGDFSRISQVSVKTLRYYDEVGLLKPVEVDRFTGYRYYAFDQLTRLYRILALKDLGFSLEQIARLLDEDLSNAELRGMLRLKQAELRQQVQDQARRLERVEIRLRQLEQETDMSDYEVVLKRVQPVLVASVRGVIPAYPEQMQLWDSLETYLHAQGITPKGPCFTIYHEDEPEIEAEVCEPLMAPIPSQGAVQVHELPEVEWMATTIHHGPYTQLGDAYGAILKWIEGNGYRICGPGREHYLKESEPPGIQNDPETVTEIQFPVEKVSRKEADSI
jgi:DNA-binding transcriptional MerR regulator